MCDYQVEVVDIHVDVSTVYITNSMCLAHSKKLLEYSFTNTTDTRHAATFLTMSSCCY